MGWFSKVKKFAINPYYHAYDAAKDYLDPKAPKDNSAEQARLAEQKRQAQIRQGEQSITDTFGQFNDQFFDNYRQTYIDAQNPALQRQFQDANDQTVYGLTRSGLLESSAGAKKLADLQQLFDDASRGIVSGADDAVQGLRNDIETKRSALISQNRAAADPTAAAGDARAAAGAFTAPPQTPVLADVFSSLLNSGALAAQTGAFDPKATNAAPRGPQANSILPNQPVRVVR